MSELLVDMTGRGNHVTRAITDEEASAILLGQQLAALADGVTAPVDESAATSIRAIGKHGLSQARLMGSVYGVEPYFLPADGDVAVDPGGRLQVGGSSLWVSVASPRTLVMESTTPTAQGGQQIVWTGSCTTVFADSTLLVEFSISAGVNIDMTASFDFVVDSTGVGGIYMPMLAASGHAALPTSYAAVTGLAPGVHSLFIQAGASTVTTTSDTVSVKVVEQP